MSGLWVDGTSPHEATWKGQDGSQNEANAVEVYAPSVWTKPADFALKANMATLSALFPTTLVQTSLWLGSAVLLNSCRLFTLISQGDICEKSKKYSTDKLKKPALSHRACLRFSGIFGVKNSGILSADKVLYSHWKMALASWNAQPNLGERIWGFTVLLAISPLKHRFCSILPSIVYQEKYYVCVHFLSCLFN